MNTKLPGIIAATLATAVCAGTLFFAIDMAVNPVLTQLGVMPGAALIFASITAMIIVTLFCLLAILFLADRKRRGLGHFYPIIVFVASSAGAAILCGSFLRDPIVEALLHRKLGDLAWLPIVVLLPVISLFGYAGFRGGKIAVRRFGNASQLVALAAVSTMLIWFGIGVAVFSMNETAGETDIEQSLVPSRSAHQVRLLGIDGADWATVLYLIGSGQLPNFARLHAEAVTTQLENFVNPSPVLWTSIATAVRPYRHSITGLLETYLRRVNTRVPRLLGNPLELLPDSWIGKRKTGSHDWLVAPIWQQLDLFKRSSVVVNWLYSSPSIALTNGVLVPDHGSRYLDLCHPGDSEAEIPVRLQQLEGKVDCRRGADPGEYPARTRHGYNAFGGGAPDHLRWSVFRELESSQATIDFAAYYAYEVDALSHGWRRRLVELQNTGDKPVSNNRYNPFGDDPLGKDWHSVRAAYSRMDDHLGVLMDRATTDTVIIVMSDHGWHYDERGHDDFPPAFFALWRKDGIAGWYQQPLSILDIAPMIAMLTTIPTARGWDGVGRAVKLLRFAKFDWKPLDPIVYPTPEASSRLILAPTQDAQYMNLIRSLGYMQ